jgi:hypothetical protein
MAQTQRPVGGESRRCCSSHSFAYLDRVNYSFAAAGGIGKDLGFPPAPASLIGALFFLGYFAGQIPGAIYAERRSAKRLCSGA